MPRLFVAAELAVAAVAELVARSRSQPQASDPWIPPKCT